MNLKILLLNFCLLFTLFSFAQNREVIELWPGKVPGEEKPKAPFVISENRSGNVTRISEVTNPILEVFESARPVGPAVVICPGGAYNILAIDKEGYEIAQWLNHIGITAFVLQYRVPQKQEGALQDLQRAIRIVKSQSEKYNLDPEKVGVIGFSAGGSLAARGATRFNEITYAPLDETDKYSARPDFAMLIYPAYLDHGPDSTLTPELIITPETPPMFIFATFDDKYSHSSLVMSRELWRNNIEVESHLMPKGGHGYGVRRENEAGRSWPTSAETWIRRVTER